MLKQTLFAAAALIAATTAFQPVQKAEAGVRIGVHIGTPYYGGGYHAPRPHYKRRISKCSRARHNIRRLGYYRISALDCSGSRYTFQAKRGGQWFRLRVRSNSGHIYKVTYF